MKQKGKIWIDANGKEVETWALNPVIKTEEKHAQKIGALALKVETALRNLNNAIDDSQVDVFEAKLKDANFKNYKRLPTIDHLTFGAFDKSVNVDIKLSKVLKFDKTYVSIIKSKFEEFFSVFDKDEKSSKKFAFLRDMVNTLLYKSSGSIDQTSVSELKSQKSNAERNKIEGWELFVEAVDLFDKAVRSEPGNRLYYIDILTGDKMRRIPLKYTDV